jgi:hypothetical protein
MLLAARHLVDRLRHPRSRADDLLALRRRFAAAPGPEAVPPAELEAARELLRLREALSAALAGVASCSGCAKNHPLPHGRWAGGHCCGGRTDGVFTDDEVAALRLAGTTPAALQAPAGDHAGCAFRGPEGCSLAPAHRPSLCVRYVCRELDGELAERGDRSSIKALAAELGRAQDRFARLRAARLEASADPIADLVR